MPPGMQLITVGTHHALCPPEYAQVAREGLEKLTPVTRPTTTASTMLEKLAASRQTLIEQMTADLGLPRQKVTAFLDGPLKLALEDVAGLQAQSYLIVATEQQLTDAMKSGWHAPMFHYNKLIDRAIFDPQVLVTSGRKQDDMVLFSVVKPGEPDAQITQDMIDQLHAFDGGFAYGGSQEALLQVRTQLVKFMGDDVVMPLNLPASQQWFGMGLLGALECKYASILSGIPRSELVAAGTADTQSNPLLSAPIDLLHEFDPNDIKPQFMPYYLDAASRKATRVVDKIMNKAGDAAVLEIINSIRGTHPADNAALVKIINDDTGMDITADLLPPPM
jgi:hypothetical protein